MFEELFELAKEHVAKATKTREGFSEPQIMVFKADNTYIYLSVDDSIDDICMNLKEDDATKILGIVTMWKNGTLDLPSMEFRKAIVELNEENNDALILLQGKDDFITKKVSETL